MANTTFSQFFPAAGASSGGGAGGGILNTLQFKSSGTFDPSDPYGDGTRAVTSGALVYFTMVAGGTSGRINQTPEFQTGGGGGSIWIGSIPLTNVSNTITITVGAGGVVANPVFGTNYNNVVGGASSAVQTAGISINTADSRSLAGGDSGNKWNSGAQNTNQRFAGSAPTMALPPFSSGGFPAGGFGGGFRGNNTGDGGPGSTLSGSGGRSGIVIINW